MVDIPHADRLEAKIDKLLEKVARLETLTATEAARCPFREDVAKARNNVARIERVETRIEATAERLQQRIEANAGHIQLLKMNWAKLLGLMVGAGTAGGIISDGIAKLFS